MCLRIPTGGGKTLLAAYALGTMSREWPGVSPKPLALWLVPSDTIRTQTLAALSTPGHPLREALAPNCGDEVRICDLEAVASLSPQDFDACAVVVAATMQSFRVEDTEQRNVYAFSEAFEPHFRGLPSGALRALDGLPDALVTAQEAAGAKAGRELLMRFVGQPRWSLANWLALQGRWRRCLPASARRAISTRLTLVVRQRAAAANAGQGLTGVSPWSHLVLTHFSLAQISR